MTFNKKIMANAVVASMLIAGAAGPAQAEVDASVGVASTYLWRGLDLGSGTPAVFGDINYSKSGVTAGIWGSSGDTEYGSEYDLYLGYGRSSGKFSYDLTLYNYVYPTGTDEVDQFESVDATLTLGYDKISFSAWVPVGKDNHDGDYIYYTLGGSIGDFGLTLGMHSDAAGIVDCPAGESECSPVHFNVDYSYNENLTFTVSQFIADEPENDDMKFVVSYSMPLGK